MQTCLKSLGLRVLIEAMQPSDSACNELDSLESLDPCLALGRGFCLLALRSILLVVE